MGKKLPKATSKRKNCGSETKSSKGKAPACITCSVPFDSISVINKNGNAKRKLPKDEEPECKNTCAKENLERKPDVKPELISTTSYRLVCSMKNYAIQLLSAVAR
jgi:hypothetical protein